jgi:hypothetical protein
MLQDLTMSMQLQSAPAFKVSGSDRFDNHMQRKEFPRHSLSGSISVCHVHTVSDCFDLEA